MKNSHPLHCLINTCQLVGSSLDLNEVLKGVTKMSKDVLRAEAGSLMLLDEENHRLNFTVALGTKGHRLQKISLKLGQGIAGQVAQTGEPIVVADTTKDPRFCQELDKVTNFATRSILAVPLQVSNKTIGVLELINPKDKLFFTPEDIPMFQAFACQVAVAIENARMHKKILEQQKLEQELAIASEIQAQMLPPKKVNLNQLVISAEYKPAKQIGGDFFDIIDLGKKIIVTVGDVTGKGIPAALYMVRLITKLHSLANEYDDISLIISKLNQFLLQRSTRGMFATSIIITIEKSSGQTILLNAGHPSPFLISNGKVKTINSSKGLPLGIIDSVSYGTRKINLKKDDSLLLYTDGIIEARNFRGKEFGQLRLTRELRAQAKNENARKQILKNLFAGITGFARGAAQHDDLTAVLINRTR